MHAEEDTVDAAADSQARDTTVVSLPEALARRARTSAQDIAVREVGGEDYTSAEFWELCVDWAGLLGEHGVAPGETVVVLQARPAQALAVWLGTALLGGIEVPVNTELRGPLLTHILTDCRAGLAVVDARFLPQLAELGDIDGGLGALRRVIVTGSSGDDAPVALPASVEVMHVDRPPKATEREPIEMFPREWDLACLLYTSGTTGPAKGVMVTWGQLFETTIGTGPERTLRQPSTVFYSPYPTFHISGMTPLYATTLGSGTVVLRERFNTQAFWDDVRTYGCTFTLLLAATANFILKQPPCPDDADNPLIAVLFSPWIPGVEEFKTRFEVEAHSVYNMTEISCPIVGSWNHEPIDPAVCGKVRPGFDVRIVDDHDIEVPAGTPGELIIRSDRPWRLMAGYWGLDGATATAWRNQWFHTGDIFSVDEHGNFRYLDRKKDSIRRRGENISSTEVEAQALEHADVAIAAAVAVPDPVGEQEIKLIVVRVPDSRLSERQLHEFLSGRLPRFMVPRYIELVDEVPRTASQKIRKVELRKRGITPTTWDRSSTSTERTSN